MNIALGYSFGTECISICAIISGQLKRLYFNFFESLKEKSSTAHNSYIQYIPEMLIGSPELIRIPEIKIFSSSTHSPQFPPLN